MGHVTAEVERGSWANLAWILVRIVLLTALPEEFLFRGALWSAFRSRAERVRPGLGVSTALLFTAFLFGLWHIGPAIHNAGALGLSPVVAGNTRLLMASLVDVIESQLSIPWPAWDKTVRCGG